MRLDVSLDSYSGTLKLLISICIKRLFVSMYVCNVFRPPKLFVPGGQTFLTHRREGGTNIFHTQGGGDTHFYIEGGDNYFCIEGGGTNISVGGSGTFDDVEMFVSKANFLVSEANILVSEANILVSEAKFFEARRALKF